MNSIKSLLDKLPPWTLSVVCFLAICWLTLSPDPLSDNEIQLFPGADKIAHAIMFGGFTLCIITDGLRRKGWPAFPQNLMIIFRSADIPSLIGILIEVLQGEMYTGRSFELWDMIADITGAFLAAVCFVLIQYLNYRRYNKEEDR